MEVCDICGDIGVLEAIITCSQCRIACEHLYCKKIFTREIQESWLCEACEQSTEMASPKSGVNGKLLTELYHDTTHVGSKKLNDDSGRQLCAKWKKTVCGKVKPISEQEVKMLSSGSKKSESPSKGKLRSSPGPSEATVSVMSMRTPVKNKATPPKISYKDKENTSFRLPEHLKPPRHGNVQVNSLVQPQATETSKEPQGAIVSSGYRALPAPVKQHIHKGQPTVTLKHGVEIESSSTKVEKPTCKVSYASSLSTFCPTIVSSGDYICTDAVEPRDSNAKNGNLLLNADKCFPSHPAVDASWKGSFKILDIVKHGELTGGLQAHPPSRVRRKVYEFSKCMPRTLQFELLPRRNFLSNIFQNDYPDTDDIALYFLSLDSGRSENYTFLLEYIQRHDLVMRSNVDGMDLLVLTSKLLHLNSQRLDEKYFLWGIFHRTKKDHAILEEHEKVPFTVSIRKSTYHSHASGEDREGVDMEDMEIDMVGGEDVGRVDIAIRKESLKVGCGSSGEDLRRSDVKNPAVSTKMDSTKQLPILELAKGQYKDIPPGFGKYSGPKFWGSSSRATVKEEKQPKEHISMKRVSEASRCSIMRPSR